jgi:hypothetical protein
MKKFLYIILFLIVIGVVRDFSVNPDNSNNQTVEISRDKFINDWNKLIGTKSEITTDTIVVYVNKKTNPFNNKDDYANEYHPKLVNGQSCKELGIKFIQVRSLVNNKMLSGISCRD